ncbi:NF038132 family protein [Methylomonas sp. OY6]|uniref:NF038132 family protein n=1 Tax=Methylomonas defluvii TaxID=3045149 RepID=A0ABU4UFH6_9GAMM|nr:NF038132 family protein [Methylomonas sp. OY6]MDX8128213.1 NF038132 family protein [Methylomonas sp. OY6]
MKITRTPLIALSLSGALVLPTAQAANISLSNNTWTASGAAGLIYGDNTVNNSPTGNAQFGYVSTSGGVYGVSSLVLRDEGRGTENQTNGSKIQSNAFSANANDTLTLQFNYISTDGRGYDDYAWARLVNADTHNTAAWLFTARSTNSANGNVVPGNVLNRQVDNNLPDELDAVLNDGNTIGFAAAGTSWIPLGGSSGICWDNANTCGPTGWIKSAYSFTATGSYFLEFGVINWGDEAFDTALAFDFGGLQQVNFSGVAIMPPPSTVPLPGGFLLMSLGMGLVSAISRRSKFAGQS